MESFEAGKWCAICKTTQHDLDDCPFYNQKEWVEDSKAQVVDTSIRSRLMEEPGRGNVTGQVFQAYYQHSLLLC